MSNKLRDMFDEEYTERFSFENVEKYNKFVEAVRKATEEGISTEVDGITGICVSITDGENKYPLHRHEAVDKVIILPYEKNIELDIKTDNGNRLLKFLLKELKDKYVLENVEGKGACYKITYDLKANTINVNYSSDFDHASDLEELIDYYNTLYFFSKMLFKTEEMNKDIDNILNHFLASIIYFKRLKKLSEILKIDITPQSIRSIDNEDLFVERLYFCLAEDKKIRSNRRVNFIKNVFFEGEKRPLNEPMIVSYMEKGKLTLLDNEIEVYSSNMAFNLIMDKEEVDSDGNNKIYFRDDDNNPMFIVTRIFLDEDEAKKELEFALDNKEEYLDSKTLFDYIKCAHDVFASEKRSFETENSIL